MTNTQFAELRDWLRKIDAHAERIADACERAEARLAAPATVINRGDFIHTDTAPPQTTVKEAHAALKPHVPHYQPQTLQDFGDAGPQVVAARGLRGKRGRK